ncbi:MAG: hypothetical protein NTV94_08495 [Planctomycetota bacterium]|nr:hypothetical protein [Planctomycetota bacterium]
MSVIARWLRVLTGAERRAGPVVAFTTWADDLTLDLTARTARSTSGKRDVEIRT